MNHFRFGLFSVLAFTLLTALLFGCGGGGGLSSVTEPNSPAAPTTPVVPPPPPPPPIDASLFPNPQLLATATVFNPQQAIVLDARHSAAAYAAGHIPGAIHTPPQFFSVDPSGDILLPVPDLEAKLTSLGITPASKIVVYDDTTESFGAGGRLFWLLEYLGCTDVSLLNGGWNQWLAHQLPVETTTPTWQPTPPPGFVANLNPNVGITKEELNNRRLNGPPLVIVDARSPDEYAGVVIVETTNPGHIPGAINIPYTACFNADKTVLSFTDLQALLASHGITADTEVAVYSTVGKRSAFIYFLARLMGYTKVVNYGGSIAEWEGAGYPLETN